jgi:hypothetical protein
MDAQMKHHAGTGLSHHRQNSRDYVRSCDCEMNLNSSHERDANGKTITAIYMADLEVVE